MTFPINIDELINGNTIEWDRIELKKGWNPEDVIHSLCAYANDINNWDGGYLIIGVAESNGKAVLPPIGLKSEQIDSIQKKLIEISNMISPSYFPVSQPYIKDGKQILIIRAPGGDNRPYKAPVSLSEKKSEKSYYINRGSKTIKVKDSSVDERKLLELTARIPFDDRMNRNASVDDIELRLVQSYLKEVMSALYEESTKISFTDLCKQLQVVKGSDELLYPTNAGLLLFNDSPDRFISGAKIELVIHKETVGKDYDEKIFTGTIANQIRDVLSFIKANVITEHVSKVSGRAESIRFFNYPYIAIEEAIVNAVYHKSYERENPVEIQILPDKIEILSFPGPLPPVDNKMLKKERVVAREYRNRKIGGFLKELKLTEGRGTGIPIIHRELEKNGSPPPILETDDERSYFLCTIKIHPLTRYKSNLDHTEMTKDVTIDKDLNIKSLKDVDYYLRSLNDQRWNIEKKKIKSEVKDLFLKVLYFSINPKTREEIFNYIGIFNNSRNFGIYIKPLIDVRWIGLTIPDKPTSKNRKYITSDIAKRLVEQKTKGINRIPVESSNIASVGYDIENKILEIEFNHGAVYQYFDVPKEVYENLINATAIGSYYFHNIKSNYEYSKK
jgi:ATP-dependent DNA helicase RecG